MFRCEIGMIGVAIGFDVEFPLVVRAQVEAGAEIILAPAATSSAHGAWRVRHAAAARAVENQCFVVRASLVGDAPWSPVLPHAVGTAGVHAPPDGSFADDGVVALGHEGRTGGPMPPSISTPSRRSAPTEPFSTICNGGNRASSPVPWPRSST